MKMKGIRSGAAKKNRRAGILFIETRECDCCDQVKDCASLDVGLTNFVWVVCKDCLNEFVYEFYSEQEVRKLKLEKLDGKHKNT